MRYSIVRPSWLWLASLCSVIPLAAAAADSPGDLKLESSSSTISIVRSAEQDAAVEEIRDIGTAMVSWLGDQVARQLAGATSRGALQLDLANFSPITQSELASLLAPQYIDSVPVNDPWGNPYDYWLDQVDLLGPQVAAVRSTGADGLASGPVYPLGPFPGDQIEQDVVWADGLFAHFPDPDLLSIGDFESGDASGWDAATGL